MSHEIRRDWKQKLKAAIPLGLGQTKPQHFADIPLIGWKNRDNLAYGWKVLSQGVCDGCALGVAGLHDWTIDSVHLCMTRLRVTAAEYNARHRSFATLMTLTSSARCRMRSCVNSAAFPTPYFRERGAEGFRRHLLRDEPRSPGGPNTHNNPRATRFLSHIAGHHQRGLLCPQKVARFLGTNNVDNAARLCHSPSTGAMKATLGVAASTCCYKDWYGTDLLVFFGSNPANDQPVAIKYIHAAKKQGTKVVLVNPYREPGMDRYWDPSSRRRSIRHDIADYWYPVAQGGDIAFLYGV